jgi:hypothetical protein
LLLFLLARATRRGGDGIFLLRDLLLRNSHAGR